MAYNAVPTVATGDPWSAANQNTYVRDNFAAGVPDIFTAAGQLAYATAANAAAALAAGAARKMLRMNAGVTAPEWVGASFCRVRRTSAQSISNDTITDISFNSEVNDTDSMWAVGSPTDIVIPFAGVWALAGQVSFQSDADGYRSAYIRIDDDETNGATGVIAANAVINATIINLASITALTAGQIVTLTCRHTAGAALDTVAYSTWLAATFIGP